MERLVSRSIADHRLDCDTVLGGDEIRSLRDLSPRGSRGDLQASAEIRQGYESKLDI
jgi:hypothetical protein